MCFTSWYREADVTYPVTYEQYNAAYNNLTHCGLATPCRNISTDDLKIPISKVRLEITFLQSHSNLASDNDCDKHQTWSVSVVPTFRSCAIFYICHAVFPNKQLIVICSAWMKCGKTEKYDSPIALLCVPINKSGMCFNMVIFLIRPAYCYNTMWATIMKVSSI